MTVATDPRKTGVNAGMTLLAASAVAVSVTGTTSETALATVTVPAGAMGLNGGLMVYTTWTMTNNANAKTLRVRLGGIGGAAFLSGSIASNATASDIRRIRNRNSASSQVGSYGVGIGGVQATTGAVVTGTADTSVAADLVISGQLAVGTDTVTLESYEVWLLP